MKRQEIKEILQSEAFGTTIKVSGWVRTKRESKNVNFINLNDGTVIHNLQIVADVNNFDEALLKKINTGAALTVIGELAQSNGQQAVEVIAKEIEVVGEADPDKYPLQPKRHSLEFLRDIAHLRYRTNTFSAIARVRHAMIYAVHTFFTQKGFFNIHTRNHHFFGC